MEARELKIEELVKDYDGQVVKALRTYQNTKEWNQYAKEFKEVFENAKRVSEAEAKEVCDYLWKYFDRVLSEYNENNIDNNDELQAFLKLKEVMDNMKQETL